MCKQRLRLPGEGRAFGVNPHLLYLLKGKKALKTSTSGSSIEHPKAGNPLSWVTISVVFPVRTPWSGGGGVGVGEALSKKIQNRWNKTTRAALSTLKGAGAGEGPPNFRTFTVFRFSPLSPAHNSGRGWQGPRKEGNLFPFSSAWWY